MAVVRIPKAFLIIIVNHQPLPTPLLADVTLYEKIIIIEPRDALGVVYRTVVVVIIVHDKFKYPTAIIGPVDCSVALY